MPDLGFVNRDHVDGYLRLSDEEALQTARRLAREEGIFVGISSGATCWAAMQVAARTEFAGKKVVSIVQDFGERYLSNPVYAEIELPRAA